MQSETIIPLTPSKEAPPEKSARLSETAKPMQPVGSEARTTLEDAVVALSELLKKEQEINWDQGNQVNRVEEAADALPPGTKPREYLKQELPDAPLSTLYGHALVAKHYPSEHAKAFGVAKLQKLIAIQKRRHGNVLPGDPGEQEVEVPHEDGSLVMKKFADCSLRELRATAQHQRKGAKATKKSGGAISTLRSPSPLRGLLTLAAGLAVAVIGGYVPFTTLALIITLVGWAGIFAGTAELIRSAVAARDRLLAAIKNGETMALLKRQLKQAPPKASALIKATWSRRPVFAIRKKASRTEDQKSA